MEAEFTVKCMESDLKTLMDVLTIKQLPYTVADKPKGQ